jgi:protein-tyrosine phosphatase
VDRLTAAGWAALDAYGVRTVIDLRHDGEPDVDLSPRPAGTATVHLPLDGIEHRDFWDEWEFGPQYGTPLYYDPFLERFPDRAAGVIRAIAQAPPGGVLFHCGHGRSRTGLISLLVLALADVEPAAIAADYALSDAGVRERATELGLDDEAATSSTFLAERGTTASDLILATLAALDADAYLRRAGLGDEELDAVRGRLLG